MNLMSVDCGKIMPTIIPPAGLACQHVGHSPTWLDSSFQQSPLHSKHPSNHHQAHLSSLIETQTLKASIGGSSSWSSSLLANTAAASCRKFPHKIPTTHINLSFQLQHSWCIMTLSFHRALGRFKSGSVAMRRCSRTTRSSGLCGLHTISLEDSTC